MERIKVSVRELKENERNPRRITDAQLAKLVQSILVFPRMLELRPLVVTEEGVVLGGNQRLKALTMIADVSGDELGQWLYECREYQEKSPEEQAELDSYWEGWREAPEAYVIRADELTAEEREAFVIKDNVPFGEWDWDALEADWDVARLEEWGLSLQSLDEDNFFADCDEGMELKESGTTLYNTEGLNIIKVGGSTIRYTDEEKEQFVSSIENYLDTYGILTGYISHLMECEEKCNG